MSRRGGKSRTKPNPFNGCDVPNGRMYWQSPVHNLRLVQYYRNVIMQMALARFRWLNLPPTCDERFLEYTLLMEGKASIAFPPSMAGAFYSTKVVTQSQPNVYDNFSKWQSVGNNGWRFNANPNSGVIVWDNNTRFPLMMGIELYARELAHVRMTKEMNRFHQQVPWILKGAPNRKNDMLNIAKQVAGGELAILVTDGFDDISVEALSTQVPFIGEALSQDEANVWNRIYMMLGIDNSTLKMERQTEDEITAQRSPSTLVKMASLQCRRDAANYLNSTFEMYLDEPIQVVWRDDAESSNFSTLTDVKKLAETLGEI